MAMVRDWTSQTKGSQLMLMATIPGYQWHR